MWWPDGFEDTTTNEKHTVYAKTFIAWRLDTSFSDVSLKPNALS